MKPSILLAFASILFSAVSYGQDSSALLKRTPYKLTVAVDKNTLYEEDIKATPFVLPDNTVQIYPGETIYIEVEKEDGVIKKMTAVTENTHPEKTLVLSFTQSVKKKVHEMMMLSVKNPFAEQLVYKATMFLLKQHKWADTDVYPVEPPLAGYETWPDIITSMALGGWQFKKK